ncbi:MAG: carboxypeptidase-like regulatory domain-containing protein [Firmicutes bacterium]|nr:carboxypeptidase-like regulatory domain-containing protein [Bacillota bacterium]
MKIKGFMTIISLFLLIFLNPAVNASESGEPGSPPALPASPPPKIQKSGPDLPDLAPSLESSITTIIKLNPGWNVISFPVKSMEKTSGFTHVIYKYSSGEFIPIDPVNRPKEIKSATGYLVWSEKGNDVEITGSPNDEKGRTVSLEPGWNLIGFSRSRSFGSDRMTVSRGGETKSLIEAMIQDSEGDVWVSPVIYNALAPSTPVNLPRQKSNEPVGRGFWIFSYQPLKLTMTVRTDNTASNDGSASNMPTLPSTHNGFENPADVARQTDAAPPVVKPEVRNDGPAALTTGTIGGKVEDNNHKPIDNARIALENGMTAYSDARGVYLIKEVPEGPHTITVSKSGFRTATGKVNVNGGMVSKALISLSGLTEQQIKGGNATPPAPSARPEPPSYRQPEAPPEPKEEPPKTGKLRVVVHAYSNGYHRWWPRKVEVYESGNSSRSWSKTWDHDNGDYAFEVYCDKTTVGKTYVIKVEWRSRNRGGHSTGTWERKVYSTDQTESIDSMY